MLLGNQALLLPTIHSTFNSHAEDLVKAKGIQEPQELRTVSSRWILSELTVNFQHHIAYSCKVRKHGTLVYRPTCDVLALLSEALWKLKNVEKVHGDSLQAGTQAHVCGSTEECANHSVHVDHVNQLIFKQIGSYLAKDAQEPFEYDELNVDDSKYSKVF